jgi:hypothetical protein
MSGIRELSSPTWQPIETAPKDKIIDLWTEPYGRVADAQWAAQKGCWVDWGMADFDGVGYRRVEGRVTHWMPLPAGPVPRHDA